MSVFRSALSSRHHGAESQSASINLTGTPKSFRVGLTASLSIAAMFVKGLQHPGEINDMPLLEFFFS